MLFSGQGIFTVTVLTIVIAGWSGCESKDAPSQPQPEAPSPVQGQASDANTEHGTGTAVEALQSTLDACKNRDGKALWTLLADPFRRQVAAMATRMGRAMSTDEIAEAYGYDRPIDELTPEMYLTVTLHSDREHDNPCWQVSEWKKLAENETDSQYAVLYELPSGHGRGLVLQQRGDRWQVAKITKSLDPKQYSTIVPDYAPPSP